jgi:PAS domain-containing protein
VAAALRGCVTALGGTRKLMPRILSGRSRLAEAVVDAMPLGVFVASPTGVLLFANPAMEKMLHRTPSDEVRLGSTHLAEIFPRIERDVRAVLARARHVRRQAVTSDGKTIVLTLSPHLRDGQIVGVSGTVIAL